MGLYLQSNPDTHTTTALQPAPELLGWLLNLWSLLGHLLLQGQGQGPGPGTSGAVCLGLGMSVLLPPHLQGHVSAEILPSLRTWCPGAHLLQGLSTGSPVRAEARGDRVQEAWGQLGKTLLCPPTCS